MVNIAKEKPQVHLAAYQALQELNKPSTYKEIWQKIKERNLYQFAENVDEANITRSSIEKKCINSTRSGFPKNEILFYRDDEGKYGLYETLSEEEKREYILQENSDSKLFDAELKSLKKELNDAKLEIEKLNTLKLKSEDFNEKYENFEKVYKDNRQQNNDIIKLFNKFSNEKEHVERLLNSLNDTKNQANFSRLEKGFLDLLDKKEKEKIKSIIYLIFFGLTILVIPITSIYFLYKEIISELMSIPFITIEIFLVYYFRIFLYNYNSTKEQILQLENRSALLKFISDYTIYKKDNNIEQNDISKFEDIIFSKISPNMRDIPTSPDVVSLIEKIAKIIKTK